MDTILLTLIVGLAVSIITQVLKFLPFIDKLGDYGKQAVVLVVAILIALFQYGFGLLNPQVIASIGAVWGLAIGWNEIILSKFESSK
jgi:short subunit fatty acids transporter